jgi:putative transposase
LRYRFISTAREAYPVTLLCQTMRVTRSGYYQWREGNHSGHSQESAKLVLLVREIHKNSGGTYGSRRMVKALCVLEIACGRARARTLMKLAGVSAKQRRKFKATTDSRHNLPVAPNLLNREFEVAQPNRVWVSDITYIWTAEGWLYLAVILDLFSRQVVGWAINSRINKHLVIAALRMAFWRRRPDPGLLFHSDRGSQYCSNKFQKQLKAYGMVSSMSRKGNCWDNAVSESFFGNLKTERVFFTNYKTRAEASSDVIDYIEMFYNSNRLHSSLGYVSPNDFEKIRRLKNVA